MQFARHRSDESLEVCRLAGRDQRSTVPTRFSSIAAAAQGIAEQPASSTKSENVSLSNSER
jgi:hypothetical protein